MKINDEILRLFTKNELCDKEMEKVAQQLWESEEVQEEMNSFRAKFEAENPSSIDGAKKIFEKFLDSFDIFKDGSDSIDEVNSNNELKLYSMNPTLSNSEIAKIKDLVKSFYEVYNDEISLDANLVSFYLNVQRGAFPTEATRIVDELKLGVLAFNDSFKNAVQEGCFDVVKEIDNLSIELSIEERHEVLVNFLASLQTLNISNINAESISEIESFESIKQHYNISGEITEQDNINVKQLIADTLANNSFIIGSVKEMNGFLNAAVKGQKELADAIRDVKNDMSEKIIASMIAFIAFEKGYLYSIENYNYSPKQIAVMISAAIESMHISTNLVDGNITIETAINQFQLVGAVSMLALLAFALVCGVGAITTIHITTAAIIALSIAAYVTIVSFAAHRTTEEFNIPNVATYEVTEYLNLALVVWEKRVLPLIENTINKVVLWIHSQIETNTIQTEDTESTSTVNQY